MRLERSQAFGIAAVLAIIVAGLVYYLLSQSAAPRPVEQPQATSVVMATTNIPPYTKITTGMVDLKEVPVATAPGNAITQKEQVVGRLAQYAISKGQLLVRGDVVDASAAQGLTFAIPKGKRAVTVALDPISGVGGFVYPGDHVDILATFDRAEVATTRVILQNTEVLAMNEQTARPRPSKTTRSDEDANKDEEAPAAEIVKSTTLAVTPQEAQRLILAAYDGSIHMILRARDDTDGEYDIAATTDWELMGMAGPMGSKDSDNGTPPTQQPPDGWPQGYYTPPPAVTPAPAAPAAPAGSTIEVIRGREHQTVTTDQ